MPKAVVPPRRGRFTPFARTPRTPVIANEDTMLPSFDNYPAYLYEVCLSSKCLFLGCFVILIFRLSLTDYP